MPSSRSTGSRQDPGPGLASLLNPTSTVDARNFALRQLSRIGAASEVSAIASHLSDEDTAVMSLYALQRIGGAEADRALIAGLASVPKQRIGISLTLGHRLCAAAVPALKPLLAMPLAAPKSRCIGNDRYQGCVGCTDRCLAVAKAICEEHYLRMVVLGHGSRGMRRRKQCDLNAADSPANTPPRQPLQSAGAKAGQPP